MKVNFLSKTNILISVFLFTVGLGLGVCVNDFPYLSFDSKVSIVDLTNFLLTLFVAVYIPFFLNKSINNKRAEKDLLLKVCDQLEEEMKLLKEFVDSEYVTKKSIRSDKADLIILRLKSIKNKTAQLIKNIKSYRKKNPTNKVCEELRKNVVNYWGKLTANLKDRRRKITPETYLSVEKLHNACVNNLLELRLQLNDY